MSQSALKEKKVTLLDLLDNILDRGMLLNGEITLSVADVDLVYIGLKSLLASIDTAYRFADGPAPSAGSRSPEPDPPSREDGRTGGDAASLPVHTSQPARTAASSVTYSDIDTNTPAAVEQTEGALPQRINADPEGVERGLAKLVLTLIELLRQLLERQALRRVENGTVNDEEIERLGVTFEKLQARMVELKRVFGLEDEDLNLDLGPLGDLM